MLQVTGPYLDYNAFILKSKITISNNKTIYYLFFVYEDLIYKTRLLCDFDIYFIDKCLYNESINKHIEI